MIYQKIIRRIEIGFTIFIIWALNVYTPNIQSQTEYVSSYDIFCCYWKNCWFLDLVVKSYYLAAQESDFDITNVTVQSLSYRRQSGKSRDVWVIF